MTVGRKGSTTNAHLFRNTDGFLHSRSFRLKVPCHTDAASRRKKWCRRHGLWWPHPSLLPLFQRSSWSIQNPIDNTYTKSNIYIATKLYQKCPSGGIDKIFNSVYTETIYHVVNYRQFDVMDSTFCKWLIFLLPSPLPSANFFGFQILCHVALVW